MRMQRQAALRVQQMQDHSRRVFEAHQGSAAPHLYTRTPENVPPPSPVADGEDTERWLLLGLAALLWRCGCRTELLLAVLYLAL